MKRNLIKIINLNLLIGLMFFLTGCDTSNKEYGKILGLENTLNLLRIDEPVSLSRKELKEILGDIPSDLFPLLEKENGEIINTQTDDNDGEGIWDELSFLYTFEPLEKVYISLKFVEKAKIPEFKNRAHAYLGYRPERSGPFQPVKKNSRPKDHQPQSHPYLYQFEGPGWESDVVAYRTYFDKRNGKDIFGKIKYDLFLDSIGLGQDYHKLQNWGMDILKVGNSLGAGSLAIVKNGSLFRLGETEAAEFEILADGPVKAVIQIVYKGWRVEDHDLEIREKITIWGGKRWYKNELTLKGSPADTLVTGIVNMKNYPAEEIKTGSVKILATHAIQSENNDYLGMAVLVPEENFGGFSKAPEEGEGITKTNLAGLLAHNNKYLYYFYTGWELESENFKNKESFLKELKDEAAKLSSPIQLIKNRE
jgi:hypothetical protein